MGMAHGSWGQYLQRELVHGMDGMEVVHDEVQQRGPRGSRPVVLSGLVNLGFCHLRLLDLGGKHRTKLLWKHLCKLSTQPRGALTSATKTSGQAVGNLHETTAGTSLCPLNHGAARLGPPAPTTPFLWHILHLTAFTALLPNPLFSWAPSRLLTRIPALY